MNNDPKPKITKPQAHAILFGARAQPKESPLEANCPDAPRMGGERVAMRDVAKKLGISVTTVALALKGHQRISPHRREQVQRAAKEMGYHPDPALACLAVYRWGKTKANFQGTIAWLRDWQMPDQRFKFRYHSEIWRGASSAAARLGYRVEPFCWEREFTVARFEQILTARGVDGVLIPPHRPAPAWETFAWNKFSIVRFGSSVPFPDSNLVTPDSFRGVVMAVNKIHEYGYRRIGMVVGEFDAGIGGGFCGGFLSAGYYLRLTPKIPLLESNIDRYREDPRRENARLQQWLTRHRPDAILINEAHVVSQLQDLGYRIPEDIAVAATSVHDMPVDAGIEQDAEAVGAVAVEILVKQIKTNERGVPDHPCSVLVEPRWQDGKSLPRRNVG